MLHIVLVEPEIPQNTGNIARTCACIGATLHLIEPLGFRLTARTLSRAGCDYWDDVDIVHWPSLEAFIVEHGSDDLHLFTGSTDKLFSEVSYELDTYLLFGRESRGLDPAFMERYQNRLCRIPMREDQRSLNLSNAAAIGAYEVLRQWGYPGLI